MMSETKHTVPCPECGRERVFRTKAAMNQSIRKKALCKRCVHKGERCYKYGVEVSDETRQRLRRLRLGTRLDDSHKEKIRQSNQKRYESPEERKKTKDAATLAWRNPESRKKYLDALERTKWLKVRADFGQIEMLEKWNSLGFRFEPNFQLHIDSELFYIDGYDAIHNVVLEYDGKYHSRPSQQEKDLTRQQKIIASLKPKKFWRYNSTTKQWTNVLGE